MSSFEIISDYSKASLNEIPEKILDMANLKMLFLERNMLVKLPEDFFYKLPSLMWLDLRNNKLKELPRSIAHHEHLEHLLLTNNNIKKLPNELGLVENLKALQVSDNPLIYPAKKIILEGTKSIKRFLKEQYEIECSKNAEKQKQTIEEGERFKKVLEKQYNMEVQEEKLIKVHEKMSDSMYFDQSDNASKETFYSAHQFTNVRPRESTTPNLQNNKLIQHLQKKMSDPNDLGPTLRVKKIEYPNKKPEEPLKIIHNVSKSDSKILLKSYFNKSGIKGNLDKIPENVLKEGWLNKLRLLLNDQERILQQERNLKALSTWRQKKLPIPNIFNDSESRQSEAPYATYPEYARIPNRSELTSQLEAFLRESDFSSTKPVQTSRLNLDKVINELVEQLKQMEHNIVDVRSPKAEMEHAGRQIQTIIDIHKKLLQLKSTNDYL